MNYLDVASLETYVSGCAARADVRVEWDKPDSTPRTDGRIVWLPVVTSSTTERDIISLRYYIKHETSHIVYSDFDYLQKVRPQGVLALLNNLFEDNRIDYLNDTAYRGDVITSNAYWEIYNERIEGATTEQKEAQRSVISAFLLDALARDWFSTSHLVAKTLQKYASDDNLQQLEQLLNAGCMDDLRALRTYTDNTEAAEHTMALARKVFCILFPDEDVEDYESKGEGGDVEAQEGTKSGSGASESEGEGGDKGEDGKRPVGDSEDRLITVDAILPVEHEHKASRTGIHLEHEVGKGMYVIPTAKDYIVSGFPVSEPRLARLVKTYDMSSFSVTNVTSNIDSNAKPLANKLRLKLQTRSRGRYDYGQKRGKLHNGSLHRILQDTPLSDRVFRQHRTTDVLDIAITLLVDCSGSMSGRKFELACATAGAMAEALRPLHIPYSVLGFTNYPVNDEPIIWNFSKFGESVPTPELVKRFKMVAGCLLENTDGDAIAYAYHQLTMRKEHRRLLVVLSDGSPAGRSHAGDISAYTKLVINNIQESNIEIYGIGIMDNNVSKYYNKYTIVNRPDELAPRVLSIIEKSLGV